MPEPSTEQVIQPLSLDELNKLRTRILHEEGFEPDVATMRAAVQSICVIRPAPEAKKVKAKKAPAQKIDLSDLL